MTLPKENLDNKPFSDLLKEAISRIPVYAPDWTDHNVHDPGITFIELFAWLTEMQIYRLNRISDKNYRKFLKLMGIPKLKPASAAKVDVTFSLLPNATQAEVPAGTIVAATDPVTGEDILFQTEKYLKVINTEITKVLSCTAKRKASPDKVDEPINEPINEPIDNTEANKNKNVYYYAFGTNEPRKDDGLYIGFEEDPGKEITLAFYLLDDEPFKKDNSSVVTLGTLIWEYYDGNKCQGTDGWKRIVEDGIKDKTEQSKEDRIEDETKHLTLSGKVNIWINIDNSMKRTKVCGEAEYLFWLRCRVADEKSYQLQPKIDCILLNTVPATHAIQRNVTKEFIFSSNGQNDYYIDLKYAPLLDNTLTVKVNDEVWTEVDDFDASKPGDTHYAVDLASGRVTFGNGINGKIPPKGTDNIEMSYFSGGGIRGNIKPDAIKKILKEDLLNKVTVKNEKEASGGTEAETLEETIQRARKELKEVTRAVTSADYEYLALNTPGVQVARAKALPRYHPSQGKDRDVPGIISVIVVPKSSPDNLNPIPSQEFLKAVYWHLEEYRLLTTELFVLPPVYVEISVNATIGVKPRSNPDTVQKKIKEKLKNFLRPVSEDFDPNKGWSFGRPVYLSEIYEIIDGVDGVDYVKDVTLKGILETETGDIVIPAEGLVYSHDSNISIISADNASEESNVFGV